MASTVTLITTTMASFTSELRRNRTVERARMVKIHRLRKRLMKKLLML